MDPHIQAWQLRRQAGESQPLAKVLAHRGVFHVPCQICHAVHAEAAIAPVQRAVLNGDAVHGRLAELACIALHAEHTQHQLCVGHLDGCMRLRRRQPAEQVDGRSPDSRVLLHTLQIG